VRNNGPTRIALNGLDYLSFENLAAKTMDRISGNAKALIEKLEEESATVIRYLGVGPSIRQILERDKNEKPRTHLSLATVGN